MVAGQAIASSEKKLTVYEGLNECVFSFVPADKVQILDIGCGSGVLGQRLRQVRERRVVGITYSEEEAAMASRNLSQVICAELNSFDFSSLGKFDCVILSHILEHLYFPESILERLKCVLSGESVLVVALPNVLWWRQRLEFVRGKWRYRDWGSLDRTHFRFFDRKSAEELLENAGYEILRTKHDGQFPLIKPIRVPLGPLARKIDDFMCKLAPGLFGFQFVYLARLKK